MGFWGFKLGLFIGSNILGPSFWLRAVSLLTVALISHFLTIFHLYLMVFLG